ATTNLLVHTLVVIWQSGHDTPDEGVYVVRDHVYSVSGAGSGDETHLIGRKEDKRRHHHRGNRIMAGISQPACQYPASPRRECAAGEASSLAVPHPTPSLPPRPSADTPSPHSRIPPLRQ